jgi:hypothetical protein
LENIKFGHSKGEAEQIFPVFGSELLNRGGASENDEKN